VPRGQAASIGAVRVAKNGYHYTKTEDRGWVLTHWLTAERERGHIVDSEKEMVQFVDGYDKRDYDNPKAVRIIPKNTSSIRKRIATLEFQIIEKQAELKRLRDQLPR